MEKSTAVKPKIKLLKFLPKAASAIRLQNLAYFSPRRNKKAAIGNENKLEKDCSSIVNIGSFPRPILSIEQAKDKQKVIVKSSSFEEKEPTSPKISCMGQIKHKKTLSSKKKTLLIPSEINPYSSPFGFKLKPSSVMKPVSFLPGGKRKQSGGRNGNFTSSTKPGRKSDACGYNSCGRVDRAPSLSQMKRFASCRGGALDNFDCSKAAAAQVACGVEEWLCYSDDEEREYSDGGEEDEVIFPVLVPADLKPRVEINLWKRRTVNQPKPLQINTLVC